MFLTFVGMFLVVKSPLKMTGADIALQTFAKSMAFPSMGEWIQIICCTCTMGNYSNFKKQKILSFLIL